MRLTVDTINAAAEQFGFRVSHACITKQGTEKLMVRAHRVENTKWRPLRSPVSIGYTINSPAWKEEASVLIFCDWWQERNGEEGLDLIRKTLKTKPAEDPNPIIDGVRTNRWNAKPAEISFEIPAIVLETAPEPLLSKIKRCLTQKPKGWNTPHWDAGIHVARKSESRKYKVGERVLIKGEKEKNRKKYYFVTSYRTSGGYMGMYRLMREDGVLVSRANITKFGG